MTNEFDSNWELSEVDKVQNPAFGAWLLWKYSLRFQSSAVAPSSHFLLFFLVLPICLHRPTLNVVNKTQIKSGLGKFCENLSVQREELFAIHERALKLRGLTLTSISFGLSSGLFELNPEMGLVYAREHKAPKAPERIKPHERGAERLGAWFESLNPENVFRALKVEL